MLSVPGAQSIWTYCEQLDRSLPIAQMRPEDPSLNSSLIQPLETLLASAEECPELPDTPAGRTGRAVWGRLHPAKADINLLLGYLHDNLPAVRFAAASALQATCKQNVKWSEPDFLVPAREIVRQQFEGEESPTISILLKAVLNSTGKFTRTSRPSRAPIRINPYVAGVPIRDAGKFFGRQDVLEAIGSKLGRTPGVKSLILHGPRRSGKTSILLRIKNGALGDSFLPVYVDMQGFAGIDANAFLGGMMQSAVNAVAESGFPITISKLRSSDTPEFRLYFQRTIKDLLAAVSPRNLLIMIDEYEVLLQYVKEDPTLALQLQHLVEDQGNLFFMFAGSHTIESIAKKSSVPLLDAARYLKISFLDHDSAISLVTTPVRGLMKYAEGVPEKVVDLTAGHPFYTQLLCQLLFEAAASSGATEIGTMHLDKAVENFVREPSTHLILTWNGLQHEEKVAGSTLAVLSDDGRPAKPLEVISQLEQEDYPSPPGTSEMRDTLSRLRDEGWLEEKLPDGSYRFSMELLRKWIAANRSSEALADEQRKRLEQALARPWRQWCAYLVDTVFGLLSAAVGLLLAGLAAYALADESGGDNGKSAWVAFVGMISVLLIYFILPMLVGRFTIGLRLLKLYPLRSQMTSVGSGRAAAYGLMLLARSTILVTPLVLTQLFVPGRGHRILNFAIGFTGSLIVLTDVLMMRLGPIRRGLFERLAGVVLMYRK